MKLFNSQCSRRASASTLWIISITKCGISKLLLGNTCHFTPNIVSSSGLYDDNVIMKPLYDDNMMMKRLFNDTMMMKRHDMMTTRWRWKCRGRLDFFLSSVFYLGQCKNSYSCAVSWYVLCTVRIWCLRLTRALKEKCSIYFLW